MCRYHLPTASAPSPARVLSITTPPVHERHSPCLVFRCGVDLCRISPLARPSLSPTLPQIFMYACMCIFVSHVSCVCYLHILNLRFVYPHPTLPALIAPFSVPSLPLSLLHHLAERCARSSLPAYGRWSYAVVSACLCIGCFVSLLYSSFLDPGEGITSFLFQV